MWPKARAGIHCWLAMQPSFGRELLHLSLARGLSDAAFELPLQAFKIAIYGFAALLIHEPTEQEEHDLDEALATRRPSRSCS